MMDRKNQILLILSGLVFLILVWVKLKQRDWNSRTEKYICYLFAVFMPCALVILTVYFLRDW